MPREGVYTSGDIDTHTEDFVFGYFWFVNKLIDDFTESLKSFLRLRFGERNIEFFTDEFTFEVGDTYIYVRMAYIYPDEVARALVEPIDIGATTSRGFYFTKIHYDAVVNEFTYHFGNGGHAEI